ncbi:hypothetical protein D9757_007642 [Collybiopsis confluens]|uniref:Uncharacterized protein n=1 Tax=Collybiopsis confluens TaxID=2823264 RepID=A0A8H5M3E0_9AGAR|nr:hypothetical protein D9757_007642 [Collybiopsis confluens]
MGEPFLHSIQVGSSVVGNGGRVDADDTVVTASSLYFHAGEAKADLSSVDDIDNHDNIRATLGLPTLDGNTDIPTLTVDPTSVSSISTACIAGIGSTNGTAISKEVVEGPDTSVSPLTLTPSSLVPECGVRVGTKLVSIPKGNEEEEEGRKASLSEQEEQAENPVPADSQDDAVLIRELACSLADRENDVEVEQVEGEHRHLPTASQGGEIVFRELSCVFSDLKGADQERVDDRESEEGKEEEKDLEPIRPEGRIEVTRELTCPLSDREDEPQVAEEAVEERNYQPSGPEEVIYGVFPEEEEENSPVDSDSEGGMEVSRDMACALSGRELHGDDDEVEEEVYYSGEEDIEDSNDEMEEYFSAGESEVEPDDEPHEDDIEWVGRAEDLNWITCRPVRVQMVEL